MLEKIARKIKNLSRLPFVFQNWLQICVYLIKSQTSFKGIPVDKTVRRVQLLNGDKFDIRFSNALDLGSILEVYGGQVYEPHQTFAIPKDALILDIGASIGDFAVFCSRKYSGSTCFCFEPDPAAFSLCENNVRMNNLESRIHRFPLAVSDAKGSIKIGASTFEAISLEEIFALTAVERFDLLKMDIEGFEYSVLLNTSPSVLARLNKIVMECHVHEGTKNLSLLQSHLEKSGFKVTTTPITAHKICYLYALYEGSIEKTSQKPIVEQKPMFSSL